MASSISIQVKSDNPSETYMTGRNGTFAITGLDVWHYGHWSSLVALAGIGQRGKTIKGGLYITAAMMDELCAKWTAARTAQAEQPKQPRRMFVIIDEGLAQQFITDADEPIEVTVLDYDDQSETEVSTSAWTAERWDALTEGERQALLNDQAKAEAAQQAEWDKIMARKETA
jgi:hypothetical protein